MNNIMTPEEWAVELGRQLRNARLGENLDQRTLSSQAGVALNVVKNLESGAGATITSLIRVLRALGRVEWLASLAPPVSISPLQMIKSRNPRLRASPKKGGRHVPAG